MPDFDRHFPPFAVRHPDREVVDARLDFVQEVPFAVPHFFVIVVQKNPFFLLFLQLGDGLGEDVPVFVQEGIADVVPAVQSLVRDLDGFALYAVLLLHLFDQLPDLRLFGFVPRIHPHVERDAVPVQQKGLPDDRIGPVFLARPLLPVVLFEIDLEIVIGAVEIGFGCVPPVFPVDAAIDRLDEFSVLAADVIEAVVNLIQRKIVFLIQIGDDFAERPQFAAGADDPGIGEGLYQRGDGIGEIAHIFEWVQFLFQFQSVIQALNDEIAEVPRRVLAYFPNLHFFELFVSFGVELFCLFLIVSDGIGHFIAG